MLSWRREERMLVLLKLLNKAKVRLLFTRINFFSFLKQNLRLFSFFFIEKYAPSRTKWVDFYIEPRSHFGLVVRERERDIVCILNTYRGKFRKFDAFYGYERTFWSYVVFIFITFCITQWWRVTSRSPFRQRREREHFTPCFGMAFFIIHSVCEEQFPLVLIRARLLFILFYACFMQKMECERGRKSLSRKPRAAERCGAHSTHDNKIKTFNFFTFTLVFIIDMCYTGWLSRYRRLLAVASVFLFSVLLLLLLRSRRVFLLCRMTFKRIMCVYLDEKTFITTLPASSLLLFCSFVAFHVLSFSGSWAIAHVQITDECERAREKSSVWANVKAKVIRFK